MGPCWSQVGQVQRQSSGQMVVAAVVLQMGQLGRPEARCRAQKLPEMLQQGGQWDPLLFQPRWSWNQQGFWVQHLLAVLSTQQWHWAVVCVRGGTSQPVFG